VTVDGSTGTARPHALSNNSAASAASAASADGDAGAGSARTRAGTSKQVTIIGKPTDESTDGSHTKWRERPESGDWRLRASTVSSTGTRSRNASEDVAGMAAVAALTACVSAELLQQSGYGADGANGVDGVDGADGADGADGGATESDAGSNTVRGAFATSPHEPWTTNLDMDFGQQSSGRRVATNRRASDGDAGAGAGASGTRSMHRRQHVDFEGTDIQKNLRSNVTGRGNEIGEATLPDYLLKSVPPPPPPPPLRGQSGSEFALSPGAPNGYGHFVVESDQSLPPPQDPFSALLSSFGVGEIPTPPPPIVNPQPKKAVSFPKVPSEQWPARPVGEDSFPTDFGGGNPFSGGDEDDDGPLVIHILDRKRNRAFSVEAIPAFPRSSSAGGGTIRSPSPLGMTSPPRVTSPRNEVPDARDDPDSPSNGGGSVSKHSSTGTLETTTGWQFPQNPEMDLQGMLWKLVCNDNLNGTSTGSLESLSRVPSANSFSARNRTDSLPAWIDTRHSYQNEEGVGKVGGDGQGVGENGEEEEYESRHCSGCGRFATATRKTRVRRNEYYFCETECWEKWLEGGMQDVVIEDPDLAKSGSVKVRGRGDSLGNILGAMVSSESRTRLKSASSLSL